MARTRARKLSLTDASREAYRRRLVGNYYALSYDQLEELNELRAQTAWKQAPSSARVGHSRGYAFHQALLRAASRWAPPLGRAASFSSARGSDPTREAYRLFNAGRFTEAADMFDVAADQYEEAGDYRSALHASNMAQLVRETRDA